MYKRTKKLSIVDNLRIMERKSSSGLRRIFTVGFPLFLAPAGGSNPAGQSLTLT